MWVGESLPPLGSTGASEEGFWDVETHLVEAGVAVAGDFVPLGWEFVHCLFSFFSSWKRWK